MFWLAGDCMEKEKIEKFSTFINKKIVLYFDDGKQIRRKEGILLEISDNLISLHETSEGHQLLPLSRIIRIEKRGGA